jgi:hypothetical protein
MYSEVEWHSHLNAMVGSWKVIELKGLHLRLYSSHWRKLHPPKEWFKERSPGRVLALCSRISILSSLVSLCRNYQAKNMQHL